MMKIKQWHIYLVNFHPKAGTKPGKIRPCLAVQPDYFEELKSTVLIPITSNIENEDVNCFPLRLKLGAGIGGLLKPSNLLIEQITSWDNSKFIDELGELPIALRGEVKIAMREFLDLAE